MSQSVPQTINILLGSSSRFRQHLFQSCIPPSNDKYKFNVVQDIKLYPDIDEKAIRRTDPKELTRAITAAKTDKLLELINADSVSSHIYRCCTTFGESLIRTVAVSRS